MTKIIKISLAIIIAFVTLNRGVAQTDSLYETPTYTLKATNIQKVNGDSAYEFDVYLLHTNPTVTPFFYAAGQYFFDFNRNIALPGDSLRYTHIPGGSQLPISYLPGNASISGNILRLSSNLPGSSFDSILISSTAPGTRILRMRIKNYSRPFNSDTINLRWRSAIPDPFTKVAAFTGEDNNIIVDISTPSTHTVDPFTGITPGLTASIIPTEFALAQNFPNPFNPTTKIEYSIPVDGKVNILIYDMAGREVLNLVNSVQTAGFYSVVFNGANLASGIYFYRINVNGGEEAKNFRATKRMVLIK